MRYFYTFFFAFFIGFGALKANNVPKIFKKEKPSWIKSLTLSPSAVDLDAISMGYYYELIDKQIHIGNQEYYYSEVRAVVDDNGTENAGQVQVSFDPSYQVFTLHELKILRDGQVLDRSDLANFKILATEADLSMFIYNGTYSAYTIIEDLRKDDKIVFSYTLKGFNPVFEQKFADYSFLQAYEPIGLMHINYVVPNSRKITFKSHNDAPKLDQVIVGSHTSHFWEKSNVKQAEYIDQTPYWYTNLNWIECSEYTSWKDVADWCNRVNPVSPLSTGFALKKFVDETWSNVNGDREQYLKKVTDFVQNEVRYMGVEVGEYSHRANNPEKVFKQRYGDCKDKSVLLVTLLREKGIQSSLVLANTYKDRGLDRQLPSPFAFNHMVVRVNLNGDQFIDPTISNQGGDIKKRYFPPYGLMLDLNKPRVLAEVSSYSDGVISIKEKYHLNSDGGAKLVVASTYSGAHADKIRQFFKNSARNTIQKQYLEFYQRLYPDLKMGESMKYEDNVEQNIFVVLESYTIKKIYNVDEKNRRYISFYSNHLNEYLPKIATARNAPIALYYPLRLEHDVLIINPNGIPVNIRDEGDVQQRDSYFFSKSLHSDLDTIKINHLLTFYESYVDEAFESQFIEDFSQFDQKISTSLYVQEDGTLWGSPTDGDGNTNWIVLVILLVLILSFIVFTPKYLKSKPFDYFAVYDTVHYSSIGGWSVVLGITLVASIIRGVYELFEVNYFDQSLWSSSQYFENPTMLKLVLYYEFAMAWGTLFGFVLSSYLFFKKRDIFRQTYFLLLAVMFFFTIVNIFVYSITFTKEEAELHQMGRDAEWFRTFFFTGIWMLYLVKSERVKGTFVIPYDTSSFLPIENVHEWDDFVAPSPATDERTDTPKF